MLHQYRNSLAHQEFIDLLATSPRVLVIQDLDGVCMGLVKDPSHRHIDPAYVTSTTVFDGSFFVLTNGEHCGPRGVNSIVERAFHPPAKVPSYLPGLAAGGIQFQDKSGKIRYIGVDEQRELAFLRDVSHALKKRIRAYLLSQRLARETVDLIESSAILENPASPTVNLNVAYQMLSLEQYRNLQQETIDEIQNLLKLARRGGLSDSFCLHLAPVSTREGESEGPLYGRKSGPGTTDFQCMIKGAVKELGVVVLLNEYCRTHFSIAPFGDISVRDKSLQDKLYKVNNPYHELARYVTGALFESLTMSDLRDFPILFGVGDTVTSATQNSTTSLGVTRGGSDRNFLTLLVLIGQLLRERLPNYGGGISVLIDSSGGEVEGRMPITCSPIDGTQTVVAGPHMIEDDPFIAHVVFPADKSAYQAKDWLPLEGGDGHHYYVAAFNEAARRRKCASL